MEIGVPELFIKDKVEHKHVRQQRREIDDWDPCSLKKFLKKILTLLKLSLFYEILKRFICHLRYSVDRCLQQNKLCASKIYKFLVMWPSND